MNKGTKPKIRNDELWVYFTHSICTWIPSFHHFFKIQMCLWLPTNYFFRNVFGAIVLMTNHRNM